jgi:hypothetical protein
VLGLGPFLAVVVAATQVVEQLVVARIGLEQLLVFRQRLGVVALAVIEDGQPPAGLGAEAGVELPGLLVQDDGLGLARRGGLLVSLGRGEAGDGGVVRGQFGRRRGGAGGAVEQRRQAARRRQGRPRAAGRQQGPGTETANPSHGAALRPWPPGEPRQRMDVGAPRRAGS